MHLALKGVQIRGEIQNIVDYLGDLLVCEDYRKNLFHTSWLDARIALKLRKESPPWHLSVIAGAIYVRNFPKFWLLSVIFVFVFVVILLCFLPRFSIFSTFSYEFLSLYFHIKFISYFNLFFLFPPKSPQKDEPIRGGQESG